LGCPVNLVALNSLDADVAACLCDPFPEWCTIMPILGISHRDISCLCHLSNSVNTSFSA